MQDRQRPSGGTWLTFALMVALLYPLSYGPAVRVITEISIRGWMRFDHDLVRQVFFAVYRPIRRLHFEGPQSVRQSIDGYVKLWR